jgi:multicomponent Na+:H+ antiporter subunit G
MAVTVQNVVTDVLLGFAVVIVGASSLGVLLMPDVFQKLHYVAPVSTLAPLLVAVGVTVSLGWAEGTTESWLALLFMAGTSPVLTHATARAAHVRAAGDWRGDKPARRTERNQRQGDVR